VTKFVTENRAKSKIPSNGVGLASKLESDKICHSKLCTFWHADCIASCYAITVPNAISFLFGIKVA
jgi:hypothetical protein